MSNEKPAVQPDVFCGRCKVRLRLGKPGKKDAYPFELAKEPKGLCANCVMTEFLYNTYPINMQIDRAGPQLLLNPAVREAFVSSGVMEHGDMAIDEVHWPTVVNNWGLPVKIVKKNPMNPYRMGEVHERRDYLGDQIAAAKEKLALGKRRKGRVQ